MKIAVLGYGVVGSGVVELIHKSPESIAKKAAMPQGIDFVPVYGIIAGAKTDLEKNRFSRPFPTNYTIKNGESVRLLGMAKHLVEPIIDFSFEINGKEKNIQLQTYQ